MLRHPSAKTKVSGAAARHKILSKGKDHLVSSSDKSSFDSVSDFLLDFDMPNPKGGSVSRDCRQQRDGSEERTIELRALINTRIALSILGHGCMNIKRLKAEFKGAKINLSKTDGPERILTIVANLDIVGAVMVDIMPFLRGKSSTELRLLVHKGQIRFIIGTGGSIVKKINKALDTMIKVYPTTCPGSTDTVVQLSGSRSSVAQTVLCVYGLLPGAAPDHLPYNARNSQEKIAPLYGGYVMQGSDSSDCEEQQPEWQPAIQTHTFKNPKMTKPKPSAEPLMSSSLQNQLQEVQTQLADLKKHVDKQMKEMMADAHAERKTRLLMQAEIDRLTKLVG